jgi:nicotinamide riboside kinase
MVAQDQSRPEEGGGPRRESAVADYPAGEKWPDSPARCYKIAFIGTHGVGKTTLCFELAARLKRLDRRVDMVKEVARSCPLPLNRDTTVDAQSWILHTQVAREIETAQDQDFLVCDRSVLDNYAYLVANFGRRPPFDNVVADWLRSYSLLAWVPVVESPRFDGVRDTDLTYQRRIHEVIGELLTAFQAEALPLDAGGRDRWVDCVLAGLPLGPAQLPLFNGR